MVLCTDTICRYSETCLQGTPQYPRECPPMSVAQWAGIFTKVSHTMEKAVMPRHLYCTNGILLSDCSLKTGFTVQRMLSHWLSLVEGF